MRTVPLLIKIRSTRKMVICFSWILLSCPLLFSGAAKYPDAELLVVQQNAKISGTVVDQDGFPLPSVTVQIKGKTIGVTTDADG
jgi:hypothetical protein